RTHALSRTYPLRTSANRLPALLGEIQQNLYDKALAHREETTTTAVDMDEFARNLDETPGFIKAMRCGDTACEDKIKEATSATSRCIPFEQEKVADTCVCCGKKAKEMVYWAKAY